MDLFHPLETYLSPHVHQPPPLIYLHHPYHSFRYALPRRLATQLEGDVSEGAVSLDLCPVGLAADDYKAKARLSDDGKLIVTIPAQGISNAATLYTTVLHLLRLCLFPHSVQKEIETKGKFKDVHQWDTFVRGLAKIFKAAGTDSVAMNEPSEAKARTPKRRKTVDANGSQAGERVVSTNARPISLVLLVQDAHYMSKELSNTFESLLRLDEMASQH